MYTEQMSSSQRVFRKVPPFFSSFSSSLTPPSVVPVLRDKVWMGALDWFKVKHWPDSQGTIFHWAPHKSCGKVFLSPLFVHQRFDISSLCPVYGVNYWSLSVVVWSRGKSFLFIQSFVVWACWCVIGHIKRRERWDFWRAFAPLVPTLSSDRRDLWLSAYFLCPSVF